MKKRIVFLLLGFMIFCSACGYSQETNDSQAPDAAFLVKSSSFFDTSDLIPAGTMEQIIGGNVNVTFDKYISPIGEEYGFDDQKRLCWYRNVDAVYYNESHGMTERCSEDEMHHLMQEILQSCVDDSSTFKVTEEWYFPDTSENVAYGAILSREHSEGIADVIYLKLSDDGQLRSISVGYNDTPALTEDQLQYFQELLNAYLDDVSRRYEKKQYKIIDTEVVPTYYQQDDNLYAFYTITFTEGPEEEPVYFCESPQFMIIVEQ